MTDTASAFDCPCVHDYHGPCRGGPHDGPCEPLGGPQYSRLRCPLCRGSGRLSPSLSLALARLRELLSREPTSNECRVVARLVEESRKPMHFMVRVPEMKIVVEDSTEAFLRDWRRRIL